MAVNALGLCLQENVALVRTHDVSVYVLDAYSALYVVGVEEHAGLFAGLEGIGQNLCAVRAHLGIVQSVVQRVNAIDAACRIGAVAQVFQVEIVGRCLRAEKGQYEGKKGENTSHNVVN